MSTDFSFSTFLAVISTATSSSEYSRFLKYARKPSSFRQRINASKGTPWTKTEKQGLVQLFLDMAGSSVYKISDAFAVLVRSDPLSFRIATRPTF